MRLTLRAIQQLKRADAENNWVLPRISDGMVQSFDVTNEATAKYLNTRSRNYLSAGTFWDIWQEEEAQHK